jgi:recombination protein RecT
MTEQKSENSLQKATSTKALAQMTTKEKIEQAKEGFVKSFGDPEDKYREQKAIQQWNREFQFALQLFHNNDYLAKMDPISIVTSVINVAQTGLTLNPELKLGYLVPRKGKLYFQSSYAGKREILMRAGIVQDVKVNLVYANDRFHVLEGSESKIVHEPDYFSDRGKLVGGYWVAVLSNGQRPFGIMPISRIEEIKNRSESVKAEKQSPWKTDFEEMAKKTILNWGFKSLPKTGIPDRILTAMDVDSELDRMEFEEWKKRQDASTTHSWDEDGPDDGYTKATVIEEPKPNSQHPNPNYVPFEPSQMDDHTRDDAGDRELENMRREMEDCNVDPIKPSARRKIGVKPPDQIIFPNSFPNVDAGTD